MIDSVIIVDSPSLQDNHTQHLHGILYVIQCSVQILMSCFLAGFTGIPDNIDAALVWSGNGKIYFYKGSKFWRFDPAQRPPVKATYPKALSDWVGIPDNVDAALQYTNGYTYFFKGGSYWRFNDRTFSVSTFHLKLDIEFCCRN